MVEMGMDVCSVVVVAGSGICTLRMMMMLMTSHRLQ